LKVAKNYLEKNLNKIILGAFLIPTHEAALAKKMKQRIEVKSHRIEMCRLALKGYFLRCD
jgi:hypothetical protein